MSVCEVLRRCRPLYKQQYIIFSDSSGGVGTNDPLMELHTLPLLLSSVWEGRDGMVLCFKPGFHYPSWRPELTGDRFPLPVNTGRVDGPSTRLVETRAQWKPVTRQLGPFTRAVNSGSGNRALVCPKRMQVSRTNWCGESRATCWKVGH